MHDVFWFIVLLNIKISLKRNNHFVASILCNIFLLFVKIWLPMKKQDGLNYCSKGWCNIIYWLSVRILLRYCLYTIFYKTWISLANYIQWNNFDLYICVIANHTIPQFNRSFSLHIFSKCNVMIVNIKVYGRRLLLIIPWYMRT